MKTEVYHLKNIKILETININKKISDYSIKIGEKNTRLKFDKRFQKIEFNDIKIIKENEKDQKEVGEKEKIHLINPKKLINIDLYKMNIQDMKKYDDFVK